MSATPKASGTDTTTTSPAKSRSSAAPLNSTSATPSTSSSSVKSGDTDGIGSTVNKPVDTSTAPSATGAKQVVTEVTKDAISTSAPSSTPSQAKSRPSSQPSATPNQAISIQSTETTTKDAPNPTKVTNTVSSSPTPAPAPAPAAVITQQTSISPNKVQNVESSSAAKVVAATPTNAPAVVSTNSSITLDNKTSVSAIASATPTTAATAQPVSSPTAKAPAPTTTAAAPATAAIAQSVSSPTAKAPAPTTTATTATTATATAVTSSAPTTAATAATAASAQPISSPTAKTPAPTTTAAPAAAPAATPATAQPVSSPTTKAPAPTTAAAPATSAVAQSISSPAAKSAAVTSNQPEIKAQTSSPPMKAAAPGPNPSSSSQVAGGGGAPSQNSTNTGVGVVGFKTVVPDPSNASQNLADLKRQKRKAKIDSMRKARHASIIQACWRGGAARLKWINLLGELKAAKVAAYLDKSGADRARDDLCRDEFMIQPLQRVVLQSVDTVELCIDGAVGLPVNCTITRVSARLIEPDRTQAGAAAQPNCCLPESPNFNPTYDLRMRWKLEKKVPATVTLIIRIDALERPSMAAKTVGYAALKLAFTDKGLQPTSQDEAAWIKSRAAGQNDNAIYLNAGQFLLPIYHGVVPVNKPITQNLIETSLPRIPGSFVKVRLYDLSIDATTEPMPWVLKKDIGKIVRHDPNKKMTTVAQVLIGSHAFALSPLKPLPSGCEALDFTAANPLEGKDSLAKELRSWMGRAFPPPVDMRSVISSTNFQYYEDEHGALVALDMMYNMPVPPPTRSNNGGNSKTKGGEVTCFKANMQYLKGADKTEAHQIKLSKLLPVGARVIVSGLLCTGTVTARNDNYTYEILYDDGDKETDVAKHLVQPLIANNDIIKNGAIVEVNFRGRGAWFPAKVISCNPHGTYNVMYSDGDGSDNINIPKDRIRLLVSGADAPSSSSNLASSSSSNPSGTSSSSTQLGAKSRVEVNLNSQGKFFVGTILQKDADGTFSVLFDDGDKATAVVTSQIRPLCSTVSKFEWAESPTNAIVDINFRGRDEWYRGKVIAEYKDDTFHVAYNDKEEMDTLHVQRDRLRARLEANYKGLGKWFPGYLLKVHTASSGGTVTFDIAYDDGEVELGVSPAFVHFLFASPAKNHPLWTAGTKVHVKRNADTTFNVWHTAVITACNDKGVDVSYEDSGKAETGVPRDRLLIEPLVWSSKIYDFDIPEGIRCLCNYKGKGKWFPAFALKKAKDSSCFEVITYEDGEVEERVPFNRVASYPNKAVEINFQGHGKWFRGRVIEEEKDPKSNQTLYTVECEDGKIERKVKAPYLHFYPTASEKIVQNTAVHVLKISTERAFTVWYSGCVSQVNADGTFNVRYDDAACKEEVNVPRNRILVEIPKPPLETLTVTPPAGIFVEINLRGLGKWVPGVIKSEAKKGIYEVVFSCANTNEILEKNVREGRVLNLQEKNRLENQLEVNVDGAGVWRRAKRLRTLPISNSNSAQGKVSLAPFTIELEDGSIQTLEFAQPHFPPFRNRKPATHPVYSVGAYVLVTPPLSPKLSPGKNPPPNLSASVPAPSTPSSSSSSPQTISGAQIKSMNGDASLFSVVYGDGTIEEAVPKSRLAGLETLCKDVYNPGESVVVNYQGKGKWKPGKVTQRVNGSTEDVALFDITYDNGKTEASVPQHRIARPPVSASARHSSALDCTEGKSDEKSKLASQADASQAANGGNGDNDDDEGMAIDDVSTIFDFHQPIPCPGYMDDYSCTTNLGLGTRACALLVVHTLTVSTTNSSARSADSQFPNGIANIKCQPKDPSSCWWGIMPIRTDSPFHVSAAGPHDSKGCFVSTGTHQIPLFQGLPPEEIIWADDPMQTLCQLLKTQWETSAAAAARSPNKQNALLLNLKKNRGRNSHDDCCGGGGGCDGCDGCGNGCNCADCGDCSPSGSSNCCISNSAVVANAHGPALTPDSNNNNNNNSNNNNNNNNRANGSNSHMYMLSNGASAFIRLADGRLRAFSNQHMYLPGSLVEIQQHTLHTLLKSYCGYSDGAPSKESAQALAQLSRTFRYNPLRFEGNKSLQSILPSSLGTEAFQEAVNTHYNKILEEI